MIAQTAARALLAALAVLVLGCSSPLNARTDIQNSLARAVPAEAERPASSAFRTDEGAPQPELGAAPDADAFVRYALHRSPAAEAAYQRWVAAAERIPQAGALPDPRVSVGLFLEEVETRVGPQEARLGVSQGFPWPGLLEKREDAATRAALAAWRRFEGVRLEVARRVMTVLHELVYLDRAVEITRENLDLLASFEEVVRARYRVGAGKHPDLIRVQVELGEFEDRLAQLVAMRPAYVAELNAELNRPADAAVAPLGRREGRGADADAAALVEIAARVSPELRALREEVERRRELTEAARHEGRPGFAVGLDYIVTGSAVNPNTPGSGDDPVLLTLGVDIPLWRDKYDALVRESIASRMVAARDLDAEANRLSAAVHRAWFDHTDADRRARLYERTLIPKAEESLRATLAGFRAGDAGFLDVLDAERTLLEFALAAERARADRGIALAQLSALVGEPIPTVAADREEDR